MADVLEGRRVGVALRDFSDEAILEGGSRLIALTRDPDLQQRCRQAAVELFSLDGGVASYAAIYDRLDEDQR